jgi:hypothetical protein
MVALTGVGSGGAALSGSGKTAAAASTVDALSMSRLENFLSRITFAPAAVARERPLVCTHQCSMQFWCSESWNTIAGQ